MLLENAAGKSGYSHNIMGGQGVIIITIKDLLSFAFMSIISTIRNMRMTTSTHLTNIVY